jgi:uncharacterized protein (DUF362 family)
MPGANITTQLELVRAAIDRIKTAKARQLVAEQNPSSAGAERLMARAAFESCERQFGWQWQNVEALLARFVPGYRPVSAQPDGTLVVPALEAKN